ncbi:hypothetical protein EYC80_005917 [Monilinia laxa]|uniref:Uncharacterized protein n=1 Tax=Monilinia laxa TaxID=61186 RepID=A0A5N6KFR0_MONLA|nr:hypothetical protein EYC80_005917 [Monilinia laxa]
MATTALEFPCSLTLDIPLPTARLAAAALSSLTVDAELSPLVHRTLTLTTPSQTILRTTYHATTNRMLRVAVNGFMESLSVVLGGRGAILAAHYAKRARDDGASEMMCCSKGILSGRQGIEGNYLRRTFLGHQALDMARPYSRDIEAGAATLSYTIIHSLRNL